jgi:plastocyanin
MVSLKGFKAGTCYVVRAYRGNVQSDPSSPFCVTQQMVVVPTPPPTAPPHVDIDVSDDTYPSSTIVRLGGSVTWKNDDTDEHNVRTDDYSIDGDLPPGGSFTYTFPRVGTIRYHCDFHQGMRGAITVVAH